MKRYGLSVLVVLTGLCLVGIQFVGCSASAPPLQEQAKEDAGTVIDFTPADSIQTDCSSCKPWEDCRDGKTCVNKCSNVNCGENGECLTRRNDNGTWSSECSCQNGTVPTSDKQGCKQAGLCQKDEDCPEAQYCFIQGGKGQCTRFCGATKSCPQGFICGSSQRCVTGCKDDSQCNRQEGTICFEGKCQKGCRSDAWCLRSQICTDAQCEPVECDDAKPCSGNLVCVKNRCEVECSQSKPCASGKYCDGNICLPTCSSTADCGTGGNICVNGKCVEGCEDRSQCLSGQACKNNKCIQAECSDNDDCKDPINNVCYKGLCRAGCKNDQTCPRKTVCEGGLVCVNGCLNKSECAQGEICLNRKCVRGCDSNMDCSNDQMCEDNKCITAQCTVSKSCDNGFHCDLDSRRCVRLCQSNTQCVVEKTVCDTSKGKCVPGCKNNAECPNTTVCENYTCVNGCQNNAGCGNNQICVGQKCVNRACRVNSDCPTGKVCVDQKTCETQCTADRDCGNNGQDQTCVQGLCYSRCAVNSDCKSYQLCKDKKYCFGQNNCQSDGACLSGQICESGNCVSAQCSQDSDCNSTQICDGGRCKAKPVVTEPASELAIEPQSELVVEQRVEPTPEPAVEPTPEPVIDAGNVPTENQPSEPVATDAGTEPQVEPSPEPTSEPISESNAEPSSEPVVENGQDAGNASEPVMENGPDEVVVETPVETQTDQTSQPDTGSGQSCTTDTQCARDNLWIITGKVCENSRCVVKTCSSNADCGSDRVCTNGQCYARECVNGRPICTSPQGGRLECLEVGTPQFHKCTARDVALNGGSCWPNGGVNCTSQTSTGLQICESEVKQVNGRIDTSNWVVQCKGAYPIQSNIRDTGPATSRCTGRPTNGQLLYFWKADCPVGQ